MATIILGLCCLSSMLGGGYVAYDRNKITEREKLYENTPGFHGFTECDYKGEEMLQITGEYLSVTEDTIASSQDGIKSFVLTDGHKFDTYDKVDLKGTRITFTGPKSVRCLDKPIKSFRFYKA